MTKRAGKKLPGYSGMRLYASGYDRDEKGGLFAIVHNSVVDIVREHVEDRHGEVEIYD